MSEIEIRRRPISVEEVEASRYVTPEPTNAERLRQYGQSFLGSLFPPIKWLRSYKKKYLPGDIISGLTVSMIRLPQVRVPIYDVINPLIDL